MSLSIMAVMGIANTLGLTDWVTNKLSKSDSSAAKIAGKVLDFAVDVTGESDPKVIQQKLSDDPKLAAELKAIILNNEHALDMAPYEDRKDARQAYKVHNGQADKIAERIIKWNLWLVALLVIVMALASYFLQGDAVLLSMVNSICTMNVKTLFDERKEVLGFYFGSSMGSKQKSIDNSIDDG